MSHGTNPSQEDIVRSPMLYKGKETWTSTKITNLIYRYPNFNCIKHTIKFEEKSGYSNPYRHLRSCLGKDKTSEEQYILLRKLYVEHREDNSTSNGSLLSHFSLRTILDYD